MKLDIRLAQEIEATTGVDGRQYKIPNEDGSFSYFPSVTTVLGKWKEDKIQKWKDDVGHKEAAHITKTATDLGTGVHNLCEAYIRGEPFPSETTPFQLARFRDIQRIIDKNFGDIWAIETALFSKRLKLAGRSDIIGQYAGVPSIIDFKTSRKIKKEEWIINYFAQGGSYGIMWNETLRDPKLSPKQTVIIMTVEHNDPQVFIKPMGECVNHLVTILKDVGHWFGK